MKHGTQTHHRPARFARLLAVVVVAFVATTGLPMVGSSAAAVPAKGAHTIEVRLRGTTGTEQAALRVGDLELFAGDITAEWMTIEVSMSSRATGAIQLAFTNDAVTEAGDRSIEVDYLSYSGTIIEADAPFVYSEGAFSPGQGCSPGFVQSDLLACGGSMVFGVVNDAGVLDRPVDPHGNQRGLPVNTDGDLDVVARGHFGGERFEVHVGDTLIGEAWTTRFWRTYRFELDTGVEGPISVRFVSDFATAPTPEFDGVDANLDVDFIEVAGRQYRSEDAWSNGHFVDGVGCVEGYNDTQTLHCNGEFVFSVPG